jgi:hypothetical protein
MQWVKYGRSVVLLFLAIFVGWGLALWLGMHKSSSIAPAQIDAPRKPPDTATTAPEPLHVIGGVTQPSAVQVPPAVDVALRETEAKAESRLTPVEEFIRNSRPGDDQPDREYLQARIDRVEAQHFRVAKSPDADWNRDVEFQIERIYYEDKLATLPAQIASNECRAAGCNLQISVLVGGPDDLAALNEAWPKFLAKVQLKVSVSTDDGVQGLRLIHGSLYGMSNGSSQSAPFYWAAFDVRSKPRSDIPPKPRP